MLNNYIAYNYGNETRSRYKYNENYEINNALPCCLLKITDQREIDSTRILFIKIEADKFAALSYR